MKSQNLKNQIRNAYAEALREYILVNPPADWQAEFGEFPPKQTAMRNYIIHLLRTHRSGRIYEAIRERYGFNGSITELDAQIEEVWRKSEHKTVENFFKGTPSKIEILKFIATIFHFETDYETFEKNYVEPENQTELANNSETQKPDRQPLSYSKISWKYYSLATVLIFIFVKMGFEYYQMANRFEKAKDTLAKIDSLSFEPKYLKQEMIEQDKEKSFVGTKTRELGTKTTAKAEPLLYFTNNIYNKKFVFTPQKWDFETDPKGEDINGEYGKPYNEEIRELRTFRTQDATLANEEIWIRFNLRNESGEKLFVDNLFLKIVGKHPIHTAKVEYNAWLPKSSEEVYEVRLDGFAQTYPFATFAEVAPAESRHFSLKVKGVESLDKQILRFKIYASCNDGKGKRYTISSDKTYVLAFYRLP